MSGTPFASNVRRMQSSQGYGAGGEHADEMKEINVSYSWWESIGLTLLLFNVPGLIVGLAIGWWLL